MSSHPLRLSVLLATLVCPAAVQATVTDPNFTESNFVFISGGNVTGMEWAPDGSQRLFVITKNGAVRIVESGVVRTMNFATETVYTNSECGLIGMAFDPSYVTNRFVYFFVTPSSSEQRIIRYTDVNNVGMDRTVVLSGLPTAGNNHDGGGIIFGRDGMIYFGIGDLGNGTGVDMDTTSLAAKIGRASPTPGAPAPSDNPFFDGAGPQNDYIWARGFRNPFTLHHHPVTEDVWTNVVGTSWEQVFRVSRGDHAGYNDFESNQPATYLRPAISYITSNSGTTTSIGTIVSVARAANVTTVTTSNAHRLQPGAKIFLSGVTDTSFNDAVGTYVTSTPSTTSFTIAQTGPDGTSTGGNVAMLTMGRSLSGGVFYDATQFPPEFDLNFFTGDYVTNRLFRGVVPGGTTFTSFDFWGTAGGFIDVTVGPDGALYYASYGGQIYRASHNRTGDPQGIVVNRRNIRFREGASGGFAVSLLKPVAMDTTVTVDVGRLSGDSDIAVGSMGTLTFTAADWQRPQVVRIDAANDADITDDAAIIALTSAGLTGQQITVRVNDDDTLGLLLSRQMMTFPEGTSDTFTVALSGAPAIPVMITVARGSGDTDITATPESFQLDGTNFSTPVAITVAAGEDADEVGDTAQIVVTAAGLGSASVSVTVPDNELMPPAITSTAVVTGIQGAPYVYDVEATGHPAPVFSLAGMPVPPQGMAMDPSTGVITWTPDATGTFDVAVVAGNGTQPDATQAFTITVAADTPPMAAITVPLEGAVVSGATSEFFGDGYDDVGTVRGEFSVDGQLVFTDMAAGNHYHINGAHMLWDTTALIDGPHVAQLTVVDTAGQSGSAMVNFTVANAPPDAGIPNQPDAGEGIPDASVAMLDASMTTEDASVATPDAAVPAPDASMAVDASVADASMAGADASTGADASMGARSDAGPANPAAVEVPDAGEGNATPGCGCQVSQREDGPMGLMAAALLALVMAHRQRNFRPRV